ncbi:hypothetical protein [Anthocerotibacter panamensis]|nr:hypothetical protein [Anthocerotibacter panamensis]
MSARQLPTDTGKTTFYQLRWVNCKGEQGLWSILISAVITA